VHAGNLMPIRAIDQNLFTNPWWNGQRWMGPVDELEAATRRAYIPRLLVQLYRQQALLSHVSIPLDDGRDPWPS
jgi:hypothetical protein